MEQNVYSKYFKSPAVDRREIFRYTGSAEPTPELEEILDSCLCEAERVLTYQICYSIYPVSMCENTLDLGFTQTNSVGLARNLKNCSYIVLFAATVGSGLDRLIARYSRVHPVKSLMLQAIGNERVESLCDAFNQEIYELACQAGYSTAPRFSPGYGDFPLEIQRDIFRVLDCTRKIGIALNDQMMMIPSKSVTAVIGIRNPSPKGECNENY